MYSEVIQQIDDQIEKLHRVRAAFPYMEDSLYGHKQFRTPPYYRQFGIDIVFCFTAPLKQEDITRLNAIGLWISQNFIIRLYAFLEYHGIIPPEGKGRLKQDLDGFDEIEILRRLRKIFAHTSGRYKAGDSEEKMLYTRIVEFFSLQVEDPSRATDYPIQIDKVLIPLAEGCKRYIKALSQEKEKEGQNRGSNLHR